MCNSIKHKCGEVVDWKDHLPCHSTILKSNNKGYLKVYEGQGNVNTIAIFSSTIKQKAKRFKMKPKSN